MKKVIFSIVALVFATAIFSADAPVNYDAIIQLGNTELKDGKADAALQDGQKAITLSVHRWEGYALAGGALMNLKRYQEAADDFSQALQRAPSVKQATLSELRRQSLLAAAGVPSLQVPIVQSESTVTQAEIVLWESIKNSSNLADFQTYLQQYPQGAFAGLSRRQLAAAQAKTDAEKAKVDAKDAKVAAAIAAVDKSMVLMPAGSFQMGSPNWEIGRNGDEGPVHPVTVQPFLLSKFLVTRADFAAFIDSTGHSNNLYCHDFAAAPVYGYWEQVGISRHIVAHIAFGPSADWRSPGFMQTDRDPVVCVTWNDAQAYVNWLREMTGHHYRLPTEAEYEYAARAGDLKPTYWGDDPSEACKYANLRDISTKRVFPIGGQFSCDDHFAYTAPVGNFRPNAFGLYDMLGNVWEWTQDCQHDSYRGAPSDGSAWTGERCNRHVVRGASWLTSLQFARFAERNFADFTYIDVGFRVARDP